MRIFLNHDQEKPIGKISYHNGSLFMEFNEAAKITIEMLFESFPGAGIKVIEHWDDNVDKVSYVKVAQVLEFSIVPIVKPEEGGDVQT